MPIGVPKVEYRLPGESEADWIDLYNCLYRERMLFLCQDLGDEVANQLISLMLYLNAEDPSQAFFMYINFFPTEFFQIINRISIFFHKIR